MHAADRGAEGGQRNGHKQYVGQETAEFAGEETEDGAEDGY